eukprot:COSAG05_NODE_260_length_12737_cov_4.788891_10_plen_83_part_00
MAQEWDTGELLSFVSVINIMGAVLMEEALVGKTHKFEGAALLTPDRLIDAINFPCAAPDNGVMACLRRYDGFLYAPVAVLRQ